MRPHGGNAYNTPWLSKNSPQGLRMQRRLVDAEGGKAPGGVCHDVLQDVAHGENNTRPSVPVRLPGAGERTGPKLLLRSGHSRAGRLSI